MAEDDVPVHLRRDGKVQIGEFVFTVNRLRVDQVFTDHVSKEQTVEATLVLVRSIEEKEVDNS